MHSYYTTSLKLKLIARTEISKFGSGDLDLWGNRPKHNPKPALHNVMFLVFN